MHMYSKKVTCNCHKLELIWYISKMIQRVVQGMMGKTVSTINITIDTHTHKHLFSSILHKGESFQFEMLKPSESPPAQNIPLVAPVGTPVSMARYAEILHGLLPWSWGTKTVYVTMLEDRGYNTPWKINGWNLQINHLDRKMTFQTSMIMFHVDLPGCNVSWWVDALPTSVCFH